MCVCVLLSPDQYGMPKLWGGEDCKKDVPTRIPTSDSVQPIPRLRVPDAYSLSRQQRIMPITRDEWYEYNRQREKERQSGHQWMNRCDFQLPHLWHEEPSYYFTEKLDNLPLPGSVIIRYRVWAWTCISSPSESSSGFQNRRFKLKTLSWKIPKYLIKPLSHSGTSFIDEY